MAMMIMNNAAAAMTLGELNKNISQIGKQLKKLSSGQRIVGAGDDASGYSISEKMRVRIRALGQNERNVQNGSALLRVAEGGVQSQLDIMRTIKEKVIDADNDTNTDIDRATIQKEIDHGFRQIENIAWETTYNGKRLLVGDKVGERAYSWVVEDKSSLLPGSDEMRMIDMNMIDDKYESLNGIVGPFDLFTHSKIETASLDKLGSMEFKGGTNPVYTIDSSFDTVDSLDGTAFQLMNGSVIVGEFVLRKNASSDHKYGVVGDKWTRNDSVTEIEIGDCSTVEDVMARIDERIATVTSHGSNYIVSERNVGPRNITGYEIPVAGAGEIAGFSGTAYLTGGQDEYGDPDDVDSQYRPAVAASFSVSGVTAGTGVTIDAAGYTDRVRFVDGNAAPSSADGVTTVGVDYSGIFNGTYVKGQIENGTLTITASSTGNYGNSYRVTSGIEDTVIKYWGAEPLTGTLESNYAYATIDVSGYSDVESLIDDLKGKAIAIGVSDADKSSPLYENGYPYDTTYPAMISYHYGYTEFVDSASDNPIDGMYKIQGSYVMDLNSLRDAVANGKSIAEAFADSFPSGWTVNKATDSSGNVIGVKFQAYNAGESGNTGKLFLVQNNLRSYTLDYGKWFDENPDVSIPDYLNDKGFRFYCASCDNQWFNIHFTTEELPDGAMPNSDPDSEDIKHLYIDVSGVTDAESLVEAIYSQAQPQLTGSDPDLNHFMRMVADGDKLIIYDERRLTDSYLQNVTDGKGNRLYEYQWDETEGVGGAKIADGVWDNVTKGQRDIYVRDLIIQDTDHASMNIRLRIPQTTMDHLFGYQAGTRDLSEFNVLTAKSREELLGNKAGKSRSGKIIPKDEKGLLDTAIDYLTNANTLIGAQNMRLGMTESNIVVQQENTTASESTIRDADMAKEMAEYTKASVLMQASQSMLAQANQNGSQVLGLLQ
ncbi:MAG: hypothetical protein E7198_05605 [Schwartzia succinivorans]|nr:hypothetical protein [Schwartzia succinivorans]